MNSLICINNFLNLKLQNLIGSKFTNFLSNLQMSHIILLIQSSIKIESRTWSDYESTQDCMEAICKIYEEHLKKIHPGVECIQYDISDLYNFIDRLTDISCLAFQNYVYVPWGKERIKSEIFKVLRGQAHS